MNAVVIYSADGHYDTWTWHIGAWPADRWLGVLHSAQELADLLQARPYLEGRLPRAEQTEWRREALVVAALGEAPSGGYAVRIRQVRVAERRQQVTLALKSPSPESLVIQIVTYPVDTVRVPKAELPYAQTGVALQGADTSSGMVGNWMFTAPALPAVPANR